MKRIRLFSSICLLVLTLACLTFGVYSAVKTDFIASGTITFNAYNLDVDAKVTITGTEETYEPKYLASNKDRTDHQMQGAYSEMSDIELNKLTFDELSGKRNVITVKFELYNYSNFQVEVSATTTLFGNAENNLYYQPLAGTLMDKSEKTGHNVGTFEISFAPKGEAIIDSTTNVKIAVEIKPVTTEFDTQAGSLVYNYMTYTLDTSNNTAETALDVVWEDYWNEDEKYATYPTDTFSVASNIAGYNVTTIAENAFYDPNDDNPHSFEYMFVPNGVTEIGANAFRWVELEYVNFPNTLETINRYAFGNIYSLKEVYIPSSVTDLGLVVNDDYVELAFYGIYDCQSIKIEEGNTVYDSRNDCNAIIETATNTLLRGCNNSFIPSGVVNIEASAFDCCNKLTSITIPSSVTSIGDNAFIWCTSLTEVTIPSTVTSVGKYAFGGCSNITKISIPACVTDIKTTFLDCYNKLTDITLQDGWDTISADLFKGFTNVESLSMPNSLSNVEEYAFEDCSNLTTITLPSCITEIGSYLYKSDGSPFAKLSKIALQYGCTEVYESMFDGMSTGLESIIIELPETITKIGDFAFLDLESQLSIEIPYGVTYIGECAFSGVEFLQSIDIPSTVTHIGSYAFSVINPLKTISIPKNVTYIGEYAFSVSDTSNISVESGNTIYDSRNNCNAIIETATNKLILGCKNTIIPSDVTSIEDSAFSGCNNLTTITIPNSVIRIGDYAFNDCSNLSTITIPNSVASIGEWGFGGCSGLTSITLFEGIASIGDYAFYGCKGLTSFTIPYGVVSIGDGAFNSCDGFTEMIIPSTVTSIGANVFFGCSKITKVAVPAAITTIKNLFPSCYNKLTDITLQDGWTSIGTSAFGGCSAITSITIPDGVTSIGASAFGGCSRITSITIPSSVTSIGSSAFLNCYALAEVYNLSSHISLSKGSENNGCLAKYVQDSNAIYKTASTPSRVSETNGIKYYTYGSKVVALCTASLSLLSASIKQDCTQINVRAFFDCNAITSITIPDSVTKIDNGAFSECIGLRSITMSNNVVYIGQSTFSGCRSLTSITLPSSLKTMDYAAFRDCRSLTSITIPSSVTKIGYKAFEGCSNLTKAKFENATGWSVSKSGTSPSIATPTTEMTAANATLLRSTYVDYLWERG